ncbi:CDGSH iron-sulfur domain-containing protein [Streptomyces sp. NPDC127117]|uniref:CDGSH iron-sulfur domain-containing protein n=1 Tax=Streptomyces sp. NPDC127117 TaxID=3345368 RepID=UPI00362B6C96
MKVARVPGAVAMRTPARRPCCCLTDVHHPDSAQVAVCEGGGGQLAHVLSRVLLRSHGVDHGQPALVSGRPWCLLPRPVVALCRCGPAGQKPWCDSTHKLMRDPTRPRPAVPAPVPIGSGARSTPFITPCHEFRSLRIRRAEPPSALVRM